MKNFLLPVLLVFAGAASLYASGECGLYPVVFVPSKCEPPYEAEPNQPTGMCMKQSDGSCMSVDCSDFAWSNAIPGRCGNGIITENNVPRCLQSYAVTNVTLHEYVLECDFDGNACRCTLQATGGSIPTPVCNCMDMEPLH